MKLLERLGEIRLFEFLVMSILIAQLFHTFQVRYWCL